MSRRGAVPPGQHGVKKKRRLSDFGVRLLETKKLKSIYGITERELRKYFRQARKIRESTDEALLQILESRLDNVVYRLGFTPSRRFSRQLISHKHVLVENKVVNIPSYRVKPDQIITLTKEAIAIPEVKKKLGEKDFAIPAWIQRKAAAGRLISLPKREEIETNINEQLIVEYYSRKF